MCYGERYCYYYFKFNLCYSNFATLFVIIIKSNAFNIIYTRKLHGNMEEKNNENV